MEQKDYWKSFQGSGKISDYLLYKGIHIQNQKEDLTHADYYQGSCDSGTPKP